MKLGKWGRRLRLFAVIVLLLIVAFVIFRQTPYYYQTRSYVVLKALNIFDAVGDIWRKDKICVHLPNGRSTPEADWSPQVAVFRPGESFAAYIGRDTELTILYNFGAFGGNPYSSVLDPSSPFYSAFYGAYIAKDPQGPFGFTDGGKVDLEMLASITAFDFSDLVLASLGSRETITVQDFLRGNPTVEENVTYAGLEGWSKIDCVFEGRGLWHTYQKNQTGYIQYGLPPQGSGEDFPQMMFYGRVYARVLEDHDVTLYLYIMTTDRQTLEDCDAHILSCAEIR